MMGTQGIKSDAGETNIRPQDNLEGVFEQAKAVIVNYKNTMIQDAKNITEPGQEFNDLDKQMSGKVQVAFN